jgi:hypothetical protein
MEQESKMSKFIDIEHATFSFNEADKSNYGDDFAGGALFALDALTAKEEDIVRCKHCQRQKTCEHARRLGINGYCSEGE